MVFKHDFCLFCQYFTVARSNGFRSQNGCRDLPSRRKLMPINFHPRAGQVLVCDFVGFIEPEMVKVRPVIVISPRLPYRSGLVAIVPISLTAPRREVPYVVRLSKNYHTSEADELPCWAKCDMVVNIRLERLDGFKIGRRKWATPQVSSDDLAAVRRGVASGLGLQQIVGNNS